jgi:uncharacterized membrane protein YfcA
MVLTVLLVAVCAFAAIFLAYLLRAAARHGALAFPKFEAIALGAVTDFFDTLGIGSYAPTTAWIRLRRLTPDENLPATLNVGHALPTVVEAAIFFWLLGVHVDPVLLGSCIGAAVLGGVVGAPLVLRAPVRLVQGVVGVALIIAAGLYAMSNLNLFPAGGAATTLTGAAFYTAVGVHFVLGALMAFGIGLYAPSLIMLSLMGLDPHLAFPIMAGACAFLMLSTGFRFVESKRIDLRLVLGIALGGALAVPVAALVVKSLDVVVLRWGVVFVVLYAAVQLLVAALRGGAARAAAKSAA